VARRLVEAGVALVTVPWVFKQSEQNFDTHNKHFVKMKTTLLPVVDQAFSALLEDLHERGLLKQTLVAWTGEFGRTPKINGGAGRDHWAPLSTLALAGGGLRMGQVIGRSDRTASSPATERFGPPHLLSTVMHTLLDVGEVRVQRELGNVANVISDGAPIAGLM
jgi:uncharacterized protein (DUF1501 family)